MPKYHLDYSKQAVKRDKRLQLALTAFLAVLFLAANVLHACEGQWHSSQALENSRGAGHHPAPATDASHDLCKYARGELVSVRPSFAGFDLVHNIALVVVHADLQICAPPDVVFTRVTAAQRLDFFSKPRLFVWNSVFRI